MDGPVWIIAEDNQQPWLLRRTKWSAKSPVRRSASGYDFITPHRGLCGPLWCAKANSDHSHIDRFFLKAQLRERYPKARVARNAALNAVADEEFKLISRLERAYGEKNKAPHDAGLCKHTLS